MQIIFASVSYRRVVADLRLNNINASGLGILLYNKPVIGKFYFSFYPESVIILHQHYVLLP